ncbi:hypothetical protein [Dyella flagellata]|uniref:Antitoxin Xre/MbcA/ParS-like toxin-binding domain-containing protein n=1 Tax=Dyella flagellata TaxID=1867833 RepID=A0ABQ5XDH8_9GAMM|nr:hypothetical protein [Dyella flagellata]GLQ88590.1 hypothetical protein GCM10007898_21600 [Dyella flagellata]
MAYGIARQIFILAERLEPNRSAIWEWICQAPIAMLGGHTALELILSGQGRKVVLLLEMALRSEAADSHAMRSNNH